jgi:HSP20 family molecular chaperone IbpA
MRSLDFNNSTLIESFMRTIDLPKEVHSAKVKVSFKNGILEVRLLKTEETKAKEVKVKID